ncbi:tyrosinase cofactor [Streptomyces sp. NPDC019539]|uniref:apotyrosinase chaperone MelC1 n=1 Tax=Streptomyces sp. NPDC019539 TaxID=3365063 RepID=UPI0037B9D1A9
MSQFTRRQGLTALVGAVAVAAVGSASNPAQALPKTSTGDATGDTPASFDEIYMGRRIQGGTSMEGDYIVRIDGKMLHTLKNADGTWVSVVDHYRPRETPRAIARAAVLALQGAELIPLVRL